MFLKKCFIVISSQKRGLHKSFLRALPSAGIDKNNSIRNGILYSDSSDIVIPSSNITDVIFNRIESFHKHKAIVSITISISLLFDVLRSNQKSTFLCEFSKVVFDQSGAPLIFIRGI